MLSSPSQKRNMNQFQPWILAGWIFRVSWAPWEQIDFIIHPGKKTHRDRRFHRQIWEKPKGLNQGFFIFEIGETISGLGAPNVPSREWIHIPPNGERENHLQQCLGRGYVSSLEGITWTSIVYVPGMFGISGCVCESVVFPEKRV